MRGEIYTRSYADNIALPTVVYDRSMLTASDLCIFNHTISVTYNFYSNLFQYFSLF